MEKDFQSLPDDARPDLPAQLLHDKARSSLKVHPLSHGQQALWFLNRLAPDSSAYNLALPLRIRSRVDFDALQRVCQTLVGRHAMLRATFSMSNGNPVQTVPGYAEASFEQIHVQNADEATLYARVQEEARRPFDLERGPAHRVRLFTRSDADHVLLLAAHHIVFDGWSTTILLDELFALYEMERTGAAASSQIAERSYLDFVDRQKAHLGSEAGTRLEEFWLNELAGDLPVLELPFDRPRQAMQQYRGGSVRLELPERVRDGLERLGRSAGTTLFTTLLAAYQMLLSRYSRQHDVLVATPTSGRSSGEFKRTVGHFVNPVVFRGRLSPDQPFIDFLGSLGRTVAAALQHQDYPFSLLVERLRPGRATNRSPIFEVVFNFQRPARGRSLSRLVASASPLTIAGLIVEPVELVQEQGQFDLILDLFDTGSMLKGSLKYAADLFDESTVVRMSHYLQELIERLLARPGDTLEELASPPYAERHQLQAWNATNRAWPSDETALDLIEATARRTPDATAVSDGRTVMTYAQLDAQADRLAHFLGSRGVGPDTLVGVGIDRSTALLIALLAVWKAGGAYVPLDPAYPAARLEFMVQDAGLALLLTEERFRDRWPPDAPVVSIDSEAEHSPAAPAGRPGWTHAVDHLAYVIYTSGSTGRPKGVAVHHAALANVLRSMADTLGLTARDAVLAISSLSFDIAGLELFLPLSVGGRVEIASREETADGALLLERLRTSGATLLQATPVTWRLLLEAGWERMPHLRALCGGEPLSEDLASALFLRSLEVWNVYGPTETTIWSTIDRVEPGAPVRIGRPIANTQIHILDQRQRPVPVGALGELYIGGSGVARGYHRRPDLTTEQFLPDPFSAIAGSRMYRSGDLGRWRPDGRLECLGRIDDQVKLRGFRIELGEIEVALERHDAVRQAVAAVYDDSVASRRLVAYVVFEPGADATASDLRRFVRRELPEHMVPSLFVFLDAIPRTPNGKVDRRALPAPLEDHGPGPERVPPHTPMELTVAKIWSEVLGVRDIARSDNFFDIGGHSLQSMQVIARIEQQIGVRLHAAQFAIHTLEQISDACERWSGPGDSATPPRY